MGFLVDLGAHLKIGKRKGLSVFKRRVLARVLDWKVRRQGLCSSVESSVSLGRSPKLSESQFPLQYD